MHSASPLSSALVDCVTGAASSMHRPTVATTSAVLRRPLGPDSNKSASTVRSTIFGHGCRGKRDRLPLHYRKTKEGKRPWLSSVPCRAQLLRRIPADQSATTTTNRDATAEVSPGGHRPPPTEVRASLVPGGGSGLFMRGDGPGAKPGDVISLYGGEYFPPLPPEAAVVNGGTQF